MMPLTTDQREQLIGAVTQIELGIAKVHASLAACEPSHAQRQTEASLLTAQGIAVLIRALVGWVPPPVPPADDDEEPAELSSARLGPTGMGPS
jgi:hypothetical protein